MFRQYLLLAALILLAAWAAYADVAPPDGYVRVSRSIILHTDEDLSDYRFFLVSGNLVKEVVPVKGQEVTLSSLGGGARYSGGTLYAIPKANATKYPPTLDRDQMEELSSMLFDKKIKGATELLREGFSAEVKKEDEKTVRNAEYRLSKAADGIKAEKLPSPGQQSNPAVSDPVKSQTSALPLVASGLLVAGAVLGAGVWYRRKKANDQ
ncbi:MAG: hypothetical protein JO053_05010 [Acidobacteria bacterium]|nr:hypothetical protein [Acidobacteriota bacterium]